MFRRLYLSAFNLVSLVLWEFVFLRLLRDVSFWPMPGSGFQENFERFLISLTLAFKATADLLPLVQSFAILEVFHSAVGLVRAPVGTSAIQISSRILLSWGVVWLFSNRYELFSSPAYFTMVFAWSVTEIVRYGYYVASLVGSDGAPALLKWLRYSLFFVLYPLGAGSEAYLLLVVTPFTSKYSAFGPYVSYAILAIYLPGFYVMYSHMIRQRRKYLGRINGQDGRNRESVGRQEQPNQSGNDPRRPSPRRKPVRRED